MASEAEAVEPERDASHAELAALSQQVQDALRLNQRLEAVCRASESVFRTLIEQPGNPSAILAMIVEQARGAVDADFAALGIGTDPEKPFEPWVFSGISADVATKIGRHPHPVGTLGVVAREGKVLRLDDITDCPQFRGFPAHHPVFVRFLGVPIFDHVNSIGNLYLCRNACGKPFSADDQHAMELLAAGAGLAIESARLYESAQRAAQSRDEMLSIVTHDLKNPLSSIGLNVKLLLRLLPAGDENEPLRKPAQGIEKAAGNMSKLIQDLLDVSQIDTGRFSCRLQPQNASALIKEAVEFMRPLAVEKGIELQLVSFGIDASTAVSCDHDRILQVLSNLIGNAIKLSPAGSTVTVKTEAKNSEVWFSITDRGTGISSEHLPHIFDRYWQAEATRQLGIGLGLAITKGIIEAHGGRIWVDSLSAMGSTFYFTLSRLS